MEKNTPLHIKKIISELHEDPNTSKVLLRYTHLLSKDVSLLQIFLNLGYCSNSNSFTRPINSVQVIFSITQEYSLQKSNIESYLANVPTSSDTDLEMRQDLLKLFYSTGVHELTSSVDLGLEVQEESSLCALWQDLSQKSMFLTPKPNKSHVSPSTRATKYLTPSPMKTPYSEESELETPRSVRGLKHLTALVKKIICKHQPTSFKNVASRLIDELIDNEGPERVKEEKNVRRRVYDAINVLIAADAVNRNGKYVNWKDNWDGFEIDSRKSEVEKRRKRVEEKKTALQNAINKLLAIKFLIHRNKKNKGLTPAVQFPFVVLSTPDVQKNTMSIKVNQNATFLQIKLAKPINLFGDMEILLALKMHKMKLANLVMFLPSKELLSYCSFNEF